MLIYVDSVASSFRMISNLVVAPKVHGISFFQHHESSLAEVLRELKIITRVLEMSSILHIVIVLTRPSAWVVRKNYVELVRHSNPCIHNSRNHVLLSWTYLVVF